MEMSLKVNNIKFLNQFMKNNYSNKSIRSFNKTELEDIIKSENYIYKNYNKNCFISKKFIRKKLEIARRNYLYRFGNMLKNSTDTKLLSCFSLRELFKYAPDYTKDPKDKNLEDKLKNMGIYLWKHGYTVEDCIGHGYQGVFWSLKNSKNGIKVSCSGEKDTVETTVEYNNLKDINNTINKLKINPTKKNIFISKYANRYLNIGIPIFKNQVKNSISKREKIKRYLFEVEKADGDIKKYIRAPHKLEDIIKMTKDIFKGLYILHSLGWSHNDICPDNILMTSKKYEKSKEFITNFQIADFGACSLINSKKIVLAGRAGYRCPNHIKMSEPFEVERKDIYSLGCIILHALLRLNFKPEKKHFDDFIFSNTNSICNKYNLEYFYGYENKKKLIFLIKLIKEFLQPNPQNRPNIKKSLNLILKL